MKRRIKMDIGMDTKPFIVKENGLFREPLYHVFYANETKSQAFPTRKQALAFLKKMRRL